MPVRPDRRSPTGVPALALALLLAVFPWGCGGEVDLPPAAAAGVDGSVVLTEAQMRNAGVETAVAEASTIRIRVRVPGSVQTPDTAQASVGSFVEGRVVRVFVLPGDVVRAGQPLVAVHTHELATAQRDLTAAEAQVRYHENALQRSETLLEAEAVSVEEVERRRAEYEAAVAERLRSEEMVEHLNPSPSGSHLVLAPRSGTVFSVDVRAGQAVLPGTPLIEMGSTEVLWVTAYVPEHTAGTLVAGDTVSVQFTSPPLSVGARLVRMGNFVDPGNRSVEMRFELDTVPAGVRPGSFAVVDVTVTDPFDGVDLGEGATVRMGDDDVVFVAAGERTFRPVIVDAVPTGEGRVAVRGLPDGAEVVVQGAYFLKAALERATEAEGGASP